MSLFVTSKEIKQVKMIRESIDKLSLFYGLEQERYHNPPLIETSTSDSTRKQVIRRRELSKL